MLRTVISIAACLASLPVFAQLSPPPSRPGSVIVPEDMRRSLEAQRPAFEAYQKCVAEHRREFDLHNAADDVIRFRDQRAMMEAALKQNAGMQQQYPGGVEQMSAVAFARYKSLGGTAASATDVRAVPTPCATPGPQLPQASSPGVPITETRRLVIPSTGR